MSSRLVRAAGSPAFLQLKNHLRKGILDGTLTDRLPSERELARMHGIAYMTARRAVDALVEERLVRRVPGLGTFISRGEGQLVHSVRSGNIGIVLASSIRHGAANPYYGELVAGLLAETESSRLPAFVTTGCAGLLPHAADDSSRRKVDGIIALGGDPALEQELLAAAEFVPIVRIHHRSDHARIITVDTDDVPAGAAMARHLLSRGYRRIAWIGCLAPAARSRLQGFRDALSEAGVALPETRQAMGDFEVESGEREALRLLARTDPPDAIACANDSMACGALRAALTTGRRVPQDVAISGFDDMILNRFLPLRLTTCGVDKDALARLAFRVLLETLSGGQPEAARKLLPSLRIGETA